MKKPVAFLALSCGFVFTVFLLLNVWGVIKFGQNSITKVAWTFGIMTVALMALLAIIKIEANS